MRAQRNHTWVVVIEAVAALAIGGALFSSPAGAQEKKAGKFKYVGSSACKKCHLGRQYKSWEKTKMAQAFEVLRPDSALKVNAKKGLTAKRIAEIKENKKKADPAIDPEKDYTTDASCLPCHTVGYGKPGGYVIPDPKEKDTRKKKKAARLAKARQGVGCESCHGPGSAHIKLFKEIKKSKRKYGEEDLKAAGTTKGDQKACVECHNEKSPYQPKGYKFDYEKNKDKDIHKHFKLKLRS